VAPSWIFFFLYAYATMHGQTHIKFRSTHSQSDILNLPGGPLSGW